MNTSYFPVQRSVLSETALAEQVLPQYYLPPSVTCRLWSRSINDLYLVEGSGAKFILRVSPIDWTNYEHTAAEIELLRFLHQRHVTVPQPVPQRDGGYIQTLDAPEGMRHAVLFTFVPGAPPHEMTEEASYRYGQIVAHLHTVTDDYPADCAGFRFEAYDMVDRPLTRLQPLFAGHEKDWDFLSSIAPQLKQATAQLPRTAPEYGICHGDVNNNNIHFDGLDWWAMLDFECFGYGWRVFDIATFINNQLFDMGKTERFKRVCDAFLEGYQSRRLLSSAELQALSAFVMLRQIWLWAKGATNIPNMGCRVFQWWVFQRCMPLVRVWMEELG